MQLTPVGEVLTTVQVPLSSDDHTWSRWPLDCRPKATGASAYLLFSCLAISVALWQGMRAPEGDICCAPIGLANAPQAIAVTVAKRAKRRIAISSLRPGCPGPDDAIWPSTSYVLVNAASV